MPHLDDPSTLDAMVNRLDDSLRREWFKHRTTLADRAEAPSFSDFVVWIEEQTTIARYERNSRPNTTQSYAEATHNSKLYNKSYNTPQQPKRPFQQRTNPGEREYRDALRQRRDSNTNPSTPTRGRSPSPNRTPSPKTRSPSPSRNGNNVHKQATPQKTSKPDATQNKCAWCTEQGTNHNHTTPNCAFFKNANAMDQWKVLYKHQACSICLNLGHRWKDCRTRIPRCTSCNLSHHANISCRPTETISQRLREQVSTSPDAQ